MIRGIDLFGYTKIESTSRLEDGKIILGGRTTRFDRNGKEVGCTVSDSVVVSFPDGTPITRDFALSIGARI